MSFIFSLKHVVVLLFCLVFRNLVVFVDVVLNVKGTTVTGIAYFIYHRISSLLKPQRRLFWVVFSSVLRSYRRYNTTILFQGLEYWMGVNDPQSLTGEYPELKAFVPSFYIDQFPVTNALYW